MRGKLLLALSPLLAAAALLSVPQASQAQWVGVGGRNFSIGIGRPYYGYGYYPGYYGSSWYGGYPYASRYNWGGGYYPSLGYYYGSPYYSSRYYYPSYYSRYSAPAVTYSYPTTSYQSFYPQNSETDQSFARLRLRVPENARVWFDDTETQQRGAERDFVTPTLTPGKTYIYQIKAQWQENGQDVTRQRQVTIRAGDSLNLDLLTATAQDAAPANNGIPRDRDADAAGVPPKPADPAPDR